MLVVCIIATSGEHLPERAFGELAGVDEAVVADGDVCVLVDLSGAQDGDETVRCRKRRAEDRRPAPNPRIGERRTPPRSPADGL